MDKERSCAVEGGGNNFTTLPRYEQSVFAAIKSAAKRRTSGMKA